MQYRVVIFSFLVDELTWCGSSTDSSGLNFTYCPSFNENDCSNQAMASFWGGASKQVRQLICEFHLFSTYTVCNQFALQSTGSVYLLLNGSRGSRPAFVNTRYTSISNIA